MAMSLSRPDPASPAQVADATFSTSRKGFDQAEVRDFLRMVSAELARLHERVRFLEREVRSNEDSTDGLAARLDDETLTRMLGEETVRILTAARESAAEIREKAEQSAARLLTEASDEATRLREEAELESSRRRADAANDAEAELSMAKQQGREMVNEARAYRERVLSELARRRELAREQIEQLVHGRDRLMQVFERARLAAVDVMAEMQPLGEPDEYVNLQPTTGPVPVMVARAVPAGDAHPAGSTRADEQDEPTDGDGAAAAESDDAEATRAAAAGDAVDASGGDTSDTSDTAHDGDDETDEVVDNVVAIVRPTDDAVPDDAEDGAADEAAHGDAGGDAEQAEDDVDAVDELEVADLEPAPQTADDADDVGQDTAGPDDADAVRAGDDDTDAVAADASPDADDAGPDDADGDERADTVVDLFARLRADTATPDTGTATPGAETPDDVTAPAEAAGDDGTDDVGHGGDGGEPVVVEHVEEDSPFAVRDAEITPLITSAARSLKRVLADEQNHVLETLRTADRVTSLDDLVPWTGEHAGRYGDAITDDLLVAARAGAALVTPDRVARLADREGRDAVDHAVQTVERWLIGPLRERLERAVADGDGDTSAITRSVRSIYREFKTQSIDEHLDDVVRAAFGRGLLAALDAGVPVDWVPDPRHPVCTDCNDNSLESGVPAGEAFPTGHVVTPAHPGCRCLLLPTGR